MSQQHSTAASENEKLRRAGNDAHISMQRAHGTLEICGRVWLSIHLFPREFAVELNKEAGIKWGTHPPSLTNKHRLCHSTQLFDADLITTRIAAHPLRNAQRDAGNRWIGYSMCRGDDHTHSPERDK